MTRRERVTDVHTISEQAKQTLFLLSREKALVLKVCGLSNETRGNEMPLKYIGAEMTSDNLFNTLTR